MDSIEKASPASDDDANDTPAPVQPEPSSATAVAFIEPPISQDSTTAQPVAPPPAPEAPATPADVPFDFQVFLDQMKTKSAEPVSKYLRSFLTNFSKKSFSANDQVKLVRDFLEFITARMIECDVWKHCSPPEFENATEAMEKLVMNRLYDYTFTPQIDRSTRPVTTDDLERDHVLRQRIRLFGWVEEKHLDVPTGEGSQGFMTFAQKELLKINHYKAPRDKLICILNCCKVIFGLLRHLQGEENADAFIPVLIFVVLKANPEHLLSNVEYINRFRNPSKMQGESGYYLSSLMGAVSFIETMDHSSLSNITQEEFEKNVEEAIQNLPPASPTGAAHRPPPPPPGSRPSPYVGEESARPINLTHTSSQSSSRSGTMGPENGTTFAEDTKRVLQRAGETISKPMTLIGKIFADALDGLDEPPSRPSSAPPREREDLGPPIPTAYQARIRPAASPRNQSLAAGVGGGGAQTPVYLQASSNPTSRSRTPDGTSMDFTAMQREIDRAHDQVNKAGLQTLLQIFPNVEAGVADMILEATNGDLGQAIEQLLLMQEG